MIHIDVLKQQSFVIAEEISKKLPESKIKHSKIIEAISVGLGYKSFNEFRSKPKLFGNKTLLYDPEGSIQILNYLGIYDSEIGEDTVIDLAVVIHKSLIKIEQCLRDVQGDEILKRQLNNLFKRHIELYDSYINIDLEIEKKSEESIQKLQIELKESRTFLIHSGISEEDIYTEEAILETVGNIFWYYHAKNIIKALKYYDKNIQTLDGSLSGSEMINMLLENTESYKIAQADLESYKNNRLAGGKKSTMNSLVTAFNLKYKFKFKHGMDLMLRFNDYGANGHIQDSDIKWELVTTGLTDEGLERSKTYTGKFNGCTIDKFTNKEKITNYIVRDNMYDSFEKMIDSEF